MGICWVFGRSGRLRTCVGGTFFCLRLFLRSCFILSPLCRLLPTLNVNLRPGWAWEPASSCRDKMTWQAWRWKPRRWRGRREKSSIGWATALSLGCPRWTSCEVSTYTSFCLSHQKVSFSAMSVWLSSLPTEMRVWVVSHVTGIPKRYWDSCICSPLATEEKVRQKSFGGDCAKF